MSEKNLKKYIQELIQEVEKELEEATTTASVDGYQTPHAFSRKKDKERRKKNATQLGYSLVDNDVDNISESELKLGVKYVNKQGKEGFIQTGGSKNPKDWFWYDGKTKHPYTKVKKELKPSKDQRKTGFGDYLKQGGRVWDNVNTEGESVNEAKSEKDFKLGTPAVFDGDSGEVVTNPKTQRAWTPKGWSTVPKGVKGIIIYGSNTFILPDWSKTKRFNESVNEAGLKGTENIPSNKKLSQLSDNDKLKIVQGTGNLISFKVPDWSKGRRNFWTVISAGKIVKKKNLSGEIIFFLPGKGPEKVSPTYPSVKDLLNGVDWDTMELRRESINEAKVHFEKKLKSGNIFQVIDRDTKGMRGTQDKFSMRIIDKKGKVIKDLGSHPSLSGAKKFSNSVNEAKSKKPVNRWLELKNDDTMHPHKKMAMGLKELKYQLMETEKFFKWYNKIKTMNELDSNNYWKRTQNHIYKIKERLINIAKTIQEIEK